MSVITYKLSELIPKDFMEQYISIVNKVRNCGNDTLIIDEDYWVSDDALYRNLAVIYTKDNNNATFEVRRSFTMECE